MEWKEVRLEDITTELSDGLHKAPVFVWGGEYIFVNAKNLGDGKIIDNDPSKKSTYEEYLKYKSPLNENTILYSIDGTIGNIARYNGEKCILGKGACYINCNPDIVDSNFLYYQLQSPHFKAYIDLMSTGSTIKHISLKTMRNYTFALPSLNTQRRISSILSSLDRKIELNNQINKQLEEMAQAIFKSWFIDFEPFKDGEFVDSELGRIPKGWRVGKLGEICRTNTRSLKGRYPSLIRYLDTGSITKNVIEECQNLDSSTDKIPSRAKRLVYEGDILFSTVRPNQKHYGVLVNPPENLIVSTGFAVITSNSIDYRYFIYLYISQELIVQKLQSIAEQSVSTYPSINASDIENLNIVIPAIDDVKRTSTIFCSIFEKIHFLQAENSHLSTLRDTLLPKLMSGEINLEQYGNQ